MAVEWLSYILIAVITVLVGFIWRRERELTDDIKQRMLALQRDAIPKGTIVMWSGTDIPDGWALCDGLNGTPDLSGRFVMGYSSGNNQIGNRGGTDKHVHNINIQGTSLNIHQMPSHDHVSPAWGCWINNIAGSEPVWKVGTFNGSATGMMKTNRNGSGQPHSHQCQSETKSHIPPYVVLAYIMKK